MRTRPCNTCGVEIYFDERNERNARGNPKPHNVGDGLVHRCARINSWESELSQGKTKGELKHLPTGFRKNLPSDAQML